jgi:muramoyltetrapeptide carboxypeptidase
MTNKLRCQLPPPLQPGDLLRVIAPSGALREFEAFQKGLEIWRARGYRIELQSNWDAREGYLAGTDSERRQQLAEAWKDPECRGILCSRGGYGSARLLEDWTWPVLNVEGEQARGDRKWLIGFSDITGLLWSLSQLGVSGVHGPVLTSLAV